MRAATALMVLGALDLASGIARADASALEEPASLAGNTSLSAAELQALRSELGAADATTRRQAFEALATLGDDALTAIDQRLEQLRTRPNDIALAVPALARFRGGLPGGDTTAQSDLTSGALAALAKRRDPGTQLASELVALLHALETQRSMRASELIIGRLFALDKALFRIEAPPTIERMGAVALPALLRHRTHPRPWLRALCSESLAANGMLQPGRAVQQDDVGLLAAVLRTYGDTLSFDAMPVVVSYVTDERRAVRLAALRSVDRFGKNAIWQLRERYANVTNREAPLVWSHDRVLAELQREYDAPRQLAAQAQLVKAERSLSAMAYDEAHTALEDASKAALTDEDAVRAAQLYALLGERALLAGSTSAARASFARAWRIAPDGADHARHEARLRFLDAEEQAANGIADVPGYEAARTLDPAFAPAAAALDELSGVRTKRDGLRRRAISIAGAMLLAAAGWLAFRNRQKSPPEALA